MAPDGRATLLQPFFDHGTPETRQRMQQQEQQNVLYLIADDLRPELFRAYGREGMRTPHLDELAATGLTFRFAYAQMAVCNPSRSSFLTGRRPHHTRVIDNNDDFRHTGVDAGGLRGSLWTTLPGWFKQRGYLTLGGGKTVSHTVRDRGLVPAQRKRGFQ